MPRWKWLAGGLLLFGVGCATQKESYTARTGVEQLLVSSAIDQSLDRIDLAPLGRRKIFLETKYLDCVDKNYIIVALHHRLLNQGCTLAGKPEESDVVVEVASGGVGTDGQELFVGIPEIPLPPPSPVAIPKMALVQRKRLNGTAKLLVLAYDARTKAPILRGGAALARSDMNNWNLLGTGTITTGSVPEEIAAATGETDLNAITVKNMAKKAVFPSGEQSPAAPGEVRTADHKDSK